MVGVEAIARDITARKMAEQALQERAKCAAFAAEVSLLLNHDEPLDCLLQRCTDAAVEHLGAALTRVWLLEPGDAASMLTPERLSDDIVWLSDPGPGGGGG